MIPICRSLDKRILNSAVLPVKERIKSPPFHCSSSGLHQTNVRVFQLRLYCSGFSSLKERMVINDDKGEEEDLDHTLYINT